MRGVIYCETDWIIGKEHPYRAPAVDAQVITVADFHPRHCHTFAFATSKGAIRMADLRASALLDNACKVYEEVRPFITCLPNYTDAQGLTVHAGTPRVALQGSTNSSKLWLRMSSSIREINLPERLACTTPSSGFRSQICKRDHVSPHVSTNVSLAVASGVAAYNSVSSSVQVSVADELWLRVSSLVIEIYLKVLLNHAKLWRVSLLVRELHQPCSSLVLMRLWVLRSRSSQARAHSSRSCCRPCRT